METIDTYIKKIKDENISKVVFDLRGNRGGNPECTKHVLSYIIDKEVDFYENNDLNKRRNRPITVKPKTTNNISDIKTYMLTDGRCASATAQMLAVVKHNELATIIGEETGGTYSTHPGRGATALKYTKLGLQVGTERESVNVPKLVLDKGIIPDKRIKLELFDIINGDDPLLNYILKEQTIEYKASCQQSIYANQPLCGLTAHIRDGLLQELLKRMILIQPKDLAKEASTD